MQIDNFKGIIHTTRTIQLVDHKTVLHRFSSGKATRSILFLNGTPFSWISYVSLIQAMLTGKLDYNIYVYDIRGMGQANKALPLYTTPTMTPEISLQCLQSYILDMDTIVDHILSADKLQQISLFGWSWGGLQACRYAQLYPEKIDRMILTSTLYTAVPAFVNFSQTLLTPLISGATGAKNLKAIQEILLPSDIITYDLGRWFTSDEINTDYYKTAEKILSTAKLVFYKNTIDILSTIDLSPTWNTGSYEHIKVLMLVANQDVTPPYMTVIQNDMQKVGIEVQVVTHDGKHPYYVTHPDVTVGILTQFKN